MATVLAIYFMEIYVTTCFFLLWLGIVGVVLTVAVGISLFFCLKENWNNLKKLESDLLKYEKKQYKTK